MADAPRIVLTGIGMRTAAGNHAIQSCATIRAGVSRLAEWPYFGASFDEEGTALVAGATRPDLGDALWAFKAEALATQPVSEALWQAGLFARARDGSRVERRDGAAVVAVPDPNRPGNEPEVHRLFAIEAREHCIAPVRAGHVEVIADDQAGGLLALAHAARLLGERHVAAVMVGGVDSLLHTPYLAALADDSRLKKPDAPAGIIPGEAAAFLVLEREEDARRRGVQPLAVIGAVALDAEPPAAADDPVRGDALSRAARTALASVGGAARITRIITDMNGERRRFLEWALVETRCLPGLPRGWQHWHPADTIGDTGAAFAGVAVGMAARAFARGYGGDGAVLICASSESGARGAACILPPH